MSTVLGALVPIFALIGLGWFLRRVVFKSDAFWEAVESLTYFVLFPALLIVSIAGARVGGAVIWPSLGVLAATMVLVAVILIGLRQHLPIDGPAFTSVFQGSIRFNTYIGLATAAALYDSAGVALFAVVLAAMIPLANLLSVLVLAHHAGRVGAGWTATSVALAANPLIIASLIGISLGLAQIPVPPVAATFLNILGKASLPLGLMAVGAGLHLVAFTSGGLAILSSATLKLMVSPLIAFSGCRLVGLDPLATAVCVLFAALPPAPSSFVLARRLGGDHELMAAMLTVHTLLAALTLPAILAALG